MARSVIADTFPVGPVVAVAVLVFVVLVAVRSLFIVLVEVVVVVDVRIGVGPTILNFVLSSFKTVVQLVGVTTLPL